MGMSGQIKHQLDATLCRFYLCRVTLHVSGVKRPSSGILKNWYGGPWYRCYSCMYVITSHHIRDETAVDLPATITHVPVAAVPVLKYS